MNDDSKKIKILVCCHKEGEFGVPPIVTVKAGAALTGEDESCDFSDRSGENISRENPRYNEMTVVYWAWKNLEKLNDPDCIGLMHYRRYFYLDDSLSDAVLRTDVPKELFREKAHFSEEGLKHFLSKGDFICPRPVRRRSVYKQYALTLDIKDLEIVSMILKELSPEYVDAANNYFAGKDCYFYNMFVFSKDIFLRYCNFIFPILEEFSRRTEGGGRLFVSERLTGVFITKLIEEGLRPVMLPVLFRDDGKKEAFRRGWKSAKGVKGKVLAIARLITRRRKESRRI